MSFNQTTPVHIKLNKSYITVNNVNNFKYIEAWIISTKKDFEIRKELQTVMHKMK